MNIVLDTNVLASALMTPGGIPAQVFKAVFTGQHNLVLSPEVFSEIVRVVQRPRVRNSIALSDVELA